MKSKELSLATEQNGTWEKCICYNLEVTDSSVGCTAGSILLKCYEYLVILMKSMVMNSKVCH